MNLQEELIAIEKELDSLFPNLNGVVEEVVAELKEEKYAEKGPTLGSSIKDFVLPNIYQGLQVGSVVADFTLHSHLGEEVSLSELLAKGPVVINFYRGSWCPYCNLELKAFQRVLPDIEAEGGQLIAISLETPDLAIDITKTNALEYLVLSDPEAKVATQFDIIYDVPPVYTDMLFEDFDIPLAKRNVTNKAKLVIPATYIIDTNFTVRFSFLDEDFRKRVRMDSVVNTLREIKSN